VDGSEEDEGGVAHHNNGEGIGNLHTTEEIHDKGNVGSPSNYEPISEDDPDIDDEGHNIAHSQLPTGTRAFESIGIPLPDNAIGSRKDAVPAPHKYKLSDHKNRTVHPTTAGVGGRRVSPSANVDTAREPEPAGDDVHDQEYRRRDKGNNDRPSKAGRVQDAQRRLGTLGIQEADITDPLLQQLGPSGIAGTSAKTGTNYNKRKRCRGSGTVD